jgi:toxin ParE1/3/4
MKYNVEILPTAWEDLKCIEDWYLVKFDVDTALKVSNHILDVIERLEDFPDTGSLTPDDWLNQQGYRMVICDKQVAIYKQIEDKIFIYHIADTRTDYNRLFY